MPSPHPNEGFPPGMEFLPEIIKLGKSKGKNNVVCGGCGKICCSNCDASVLAYCKCFGGAGAGAGNLAVQIFSLGMAPDVKSKCNSCGCHKDKHSFKK